MQKFIDFVLRGKDLLSGKTDGAAESVGGLKTEIKELDKELKQVEQTQEGIKTFESLTEESKQLDAALEQTKQSLTKFSKEQASASVKVEKAANSYKELSVNAKALDNTYKNQTQSLTKTNTSLEKATVKMREQSAAVKSNEKAIADTNKSYAEQQAKLKSLEAEYKNTKKPVDDLNNSYKVAQSQLAALEQVQRKQATELEKTKSAYAQSANEVERLSKSQASFKQSIDTTKTAITKTTQELNKFENEQAQANQQLDAANRNYTATSKALNKFTTDLTKVNSTLTKVKSKLTSSGVDTNKLSGATENLSNKQKELTANIKKSFGALANMQRNLTGVRGAMQRTGQSVGSMTTNLVAMAGTYIGIRGLYNQLVNFVSVGAKFETFRLQFNGIMGSVAEGEQAFQWVKDFARETPLDMEQTTQAFLALKGAGLDPMDGILQKLTDSTAKYTGGTSKLQGIVTQLSQAYAKGKVNTEDFNNAQDNGLPVWELLSQATNKTVGELRNLSEQGKLGRYAIKQLFDEMGSDALGAATQLMGSFNGQLAVAKYNIQEFLDTIAQSGALNFLTEKLTGLNAQIKAMAADGSLKVYAQELSDKFVSMATSVSSSLKALFTDLNGFASSVKTTFLAVSVPIKVFNIGIQAIISSFAALLKVASQAMSGIYSLFNLMPNVISRSVDEVTKFMAAMEGEATAQMTQNITDLHDIMGKLKGSSAESGEEFGKFNKKIGEVTLQVKPLADALGLTAEQAKEMAKGVLGAGDQIGKAEIPIDRLKETISVLIAKLKEDPSDEVKAMVDRLTTVYQSLGNSVNTESNKVKKSLQDIEQEFRNTGGKSLTDLQSNVAKTVEVFQRFSEAKKPVSELRQAFLNQLDAQLELAKAQNDNLLPSNLALQASTLGLTSEYDAAGQELQEYNGHIQGLLGLTDKLEEKQEQLRKGQKNGRKLTKQQKEAQEDLNKANAEAESHAGANAAFQKLWNEAKEYSIRLYDLAAVSVENLRVRTQALNIELSNAFRTQSWSHIMKPINDLTNEARRNEVQAIEQEKAYRKLFARIEKGAVPLNQLNYYAQNASTHFDKLADTRLSALTAQIERAKDATANLKDELNDTLSDLKNELDEMEGNQQAVLKRNYAADKKELEEKLTQAKKAGDSKAVNDAVEALKIQKEIFNLKTAEAKIDAVSTTKSIQEINKNNTNTNIKQSVKVQDIRYTVTFKTSNSAATFTGGGKDVERFLQQLQEQGLTVTRG